MSEQKICPTCGTEYPLSERFCPRDGTALRSSNASGDLLGTIVADRYHIIKKLGEGGMGTVYLAEHVKMGRKSALKVMNPGMNADPDAIARFNREAANASRLSHPNICGIYDFGETSEGLIYLAMEFIEGKPLTDLIEGVGGLAPARAGSIVHQAADALQVAHDAGIVHRDLKPDNIMVARNRDGSDLVKVVDFGIAKASSSDAQKVTKTGLVVGTPEYMSPEQLAGDKLDGRSDIYSLALVAFNCLTGKLPFPSETAQEAMIMRLTDRPRTLAEMRPDVAWPAALQQVMDRALTRDAAERYQSAAQFGREFAAALQEMPAVAATEGATMVIGAQAAASAPTKAVPATRVSKHETAAPPPAPARKPAVPEKKSSMLPMAIGGVAVVVAATLGYLKLGGGAGDGANATDPGQKVAAAPDTSATQQEGVATPPPAGTPQDDPAIRPLSQQMNPSTPPTRTGEQTRNAPPSTPAPAPARDATAELLQSWRDRFGSKLDSTQAPRLGQQARREVEPLLPTLQGAQLEQAQFILFFAAVLREDEGSVCKYAAPVLASKLQDVEKAMARQMQSAYGCQ